MNAIVKYHKGTGSPIYDDAVKIRTQVFVIEQRIDSRIEIDEYEELASYVVLYEGEKPVSTGRYRQTENGIKLERFATLPDNRGKGSGKIVLGEILKHILPTEKIIYLHSQETAVNFYLKCGFVIQGDAFYEAGIRHFKMIYLVRKIL